MKVYEIVVEEKFKKSFEVEAENSNDAIEYVKRLYKNSSIDYNEDDSVELEIKCDFF